MELAVGVACRSSVRAYCESTTESNSQNSNQLSMWQQLLEFGTLPRGEKLFTACVGVFVREGTKASHKSFVKACTAHTGSP